MRMVGRGLWKLRGGRIVRATAVASSSPFCSIFTKTTSESSLCSLPPIRVGYTESAGRGTFATRPIAAGDIIHTADPLLTHPSSHLLYQVCYLCLRRFSSKPPSSAADPTVHFCSQHCRESAQVFHVVEKSADWSAFDAHCRLQGLKYPFLVKRLVCMVISGAVPTDSLDILQPANLFPDVLPEMEKEFGLLRDPLLRAGFDEQIAFLTEQWYIGVLARIRINAFRVELVGSSYEDLLSAAAASVASESAVGNAIYMLPSFYNHDCDPNAHIMWIENAHARMKALRNIEAGEELCICYLDASMDRDARQTILSQGFGFQCSCLRCEAGD